LFYDENVEETVDYLLGNVEKCGDLVQEQFIIIDRYSRFFRSKNRQQQNQPIEHLYTLGTNIIQIICFVIQKLSMNSQILDSDSPFWIKS